MVDKLQCCCSM